MAGWALRRSQDATSQEVDLLILAMSEVLPYLATRKVTGAAQGLDGFRRALLRLLAPTLRFAEATGNPLTREELQRLTQYQTTLQERVLTPEEAGDFRVIVDKMKADYPKKPDSGALAAAAAILVGLAALVASARMESPPDTATDHAT